MTAPALAAPPAKRAWPTYLVIAAASLAIGVAGGLWRGHRGGEPVLPSALFVGTQPAGAQVEVDGRKLAETSPTVIRWGAGGRHTVKLHKDGYGDVERSVSVGNGERSLVDIALPPRSHQVEVKTAPPGATVYLDGKGVQGYTPTMMTVVDDDFHEVRVERGGYETLTYSLKPEDRRNEILLTLEPEKQPRGSLVVDSNGAAEVWIDGVYTGFVTPTIGMQVLAGEHTLQLFASGGIQSPKTKLTIKTGETTYVTLPLASGASK
jgi:hypothetical protein